MDDDKNISAWTERMLHDAPTRSPEQARTFVHDLYFAAQRALDKEEWEADFEREE
jgi:hypothetical protein